jgi:hypothetical protein
LVATGFSPPHIGSLTTGRGFGLPSPESQCSDDFPAQQGIDEFAELLTIGTNVTANELIMKTTRNRLTNEIVRERSRSLWQRSLIGRDAWLPVP